MQKNGRGNKRDNVRREKTSKETRCLQEKQKIAGKKKTSKIKRVWKGTKKVLNYITDTVERFDKLQRYKAPAYCYNCGWQGDVFILKGLTTNEAFSEMNCPNCQCRTLFEVIAKKSRK